MKTFDEAWAEFEGIQYGFTREEAAAMWSCAQSRWRGELTVEVGSMQGGSACLLEATGRSVICIDPIEHPDYYAMFLRNTQGKRIVHHRCKDAELWDSWSRLYPWPLVGFLLIDHDHSYQSTLDSLLRWKPLCAPGAVILVHDYGDPHWVDVKPATDASGLDIQGVCGRLAWGQWKCQR